MYFIDGNRVRNADNHSDGGAAFTARIIGHVPVRDRMLFTGKHPNKVAVACARETVGRVWESPQLAAVW